MTSITMLKFKILLTSYGFSQYQSYTDFDIKLDGFIRIFSQILTNYEVKQILIWSKYDHGRHN